MPQRVIVVGVGASGLMAIGCAAKRGAAVTLMEATSQPGTKFNLTGCGRSNLAPDADIGICRATA